MELTVEQLLAEAGQMALELRVKDKLITAQRARIAELEAPAGDEPEVPADGPPGPAEAASQDAGAPS